jgi:hypothetical protein
MLEKRREIYRSSNGDAWFLCRDPHGRVFVEHEPNLPSGGRATRVEVAAFLARGAAGPEHQCLIDLIGSLVDQAPPEQGSVRIA